MKIKFLGTLAVLLVVVMLSSSAIVFAEPEPGFQKGKTGEHGSKQFANIAKELNLTDEQQAQMKEHRQEHKQKAKEVKEVLKAKRQELKQELENPEVDKSKVYSIANEIESLVGKQLELRVEKVLAMREILTPEQFQQLQEKKMSKKGKKFAGKKGRRGGYPGCCRQEAE
ncbi:MAG: Spy/CpxP family protein refolding chaperone [Candidatus Omnitrophota bacterium]